METDHDSALSSSTSRIVADVDEQPPRSPQRQSSQVDLIDEAEDAGPGTSANSRPMQRPQEQVMANSDVLSHILSYITPETENLQIHRAYLSTILAVALTCRASCDTALDHLWQTMDTLLPLFKLLPSVVQRDGLYFYDGDIRGDTQGSFYRYSRRIRRILLSSFGRLRPLLTILPRLYFQLGYANLNMLSNLRKIRFQDPDPDAFIIIPLLFSSTLTSIEIALSGIPDPVPITMDRFVVLLLPLLRSSGTMALRHLSVEDFDRDFPSEFWQSLSMLPSLETLSVSSRTMATMDNLKDGLGGLTSLTSLSLECYEPITFSQTGRPRLSATQSEDGESHPIATRLTSCEVDFAAAGTVNRSLSMLSQTSLPPWVTKAVIDVGGLTASSIPAFCHCLTGWGSLHTLVIRTGLTDSGVHWPEGCIYVLLRIPTLENLVLGTSNLSLADNSNLSGVVTVTEAVLDRMATLISEEQHLKLLSLPSRFGPALHSLARFSTKAVGLEELQIGVNSSLTWEVASNSRERDSSNSSASDSSNLLTTPPSSIRRLWIHDNRGSAFDPQEYVKIARFMIEEFPNLESMEPMLSLFDENERYRDWMHIEYLRKLLKSHYRPSVVS